MKESQKLLKEAFQPVCPALAVDLDGCCNESPIFFSILTSNWPGKVFVITFREDKEKAKEDLDKFQITYDEVILVNSFDQKAEVIVEKGIMFYFDDQPEMLKNIPSDVTVMLVRNGGNFCFDEKLWMFSNQTGKLISN